VKYGLRVEAEGHHVGPWHCTPVDRRLTLMGWEGFTVVEESKNSWALYFDVDDDGLSKVPADKRIMEIELTRKEMRMQKGDSVLG
jgi:RNase P/RNase MRP subunit p29